MRLQMQILSWVGLLVTMVVARGHAAEEPYLAVRTGLKCSQCHVNRTGGGGRSDFGSVWAQTQLPMRTVGIRNRAVNDWISLGLDLRVFASGTVSETTPRTEIGLEEAQVQIQASLVPNVLSFYVDQTLGPGGATAREVFALVEWRPLNGYTKAGKFMLPFGWRLWDDAAYVRQETGFTYKTPDLGVEVGIEPGPLAWSVAVSNGFTGPAENDSFKQVTARAAFIHRHFRLGASASRNSSADSKREVVGGFGAFSVGPLAVLGEVDYIFDTESNLGASADSLPDQFVAYVEGNLLLAKGLNAKVTYGYHDRNLDVVEDQRIRMRFGLEVFPVSFVQLTAFYTMLDDIPQIPTDFDTIALGAHLHF